MEPRYSVFSRIEEGRPKLITVADADAATLARLRFHVSAIIPYQATPNGLPAAGELDRVSKIETQLQSALTGLHLGHVTANGEFQVVFRTGTPPPESVEIKTGFLKKTTVRLVWREDAQGAFFTSEMRPTPVEYEIIHSEPLFEQFAKLGDIAERPRWVDFGVQFPTLVGRTTFLEAVTEAGYQVTEKGLWQHTNPDDFWCEIKRETSIEPEVIGAHCAYLRAEAKRQRGDLDGWACPVQH